MDWSATRRASTSAIQATRGGVKSSTAQAYSQTGPYTSSQPTFGLQQPFQLSVQQPFQTGRVSDNQMTYGDIIREYFISPTTTITIPQILVAPPPAPDFDPNMSLDDDRHTALHWACAMGHVRVVKLLLTAEPYELLHHSNLKGFHHIVDLAMSKGKTHAARCHMETLLNLLLDFPRELADIINFQSQDGKTGLTPAARCRSKRLVKPLLDHGPDPKIRNADQKTTEDYIVDDDGSVTCLICGYRRWCCQDHPRCRERMVLDFITRLLLGMPPGNGPKTWPSSSTILRRHLIKNSPAKIAIFAGAGSSRQHSSEDCPVLAGKSGFRMKKRGRRLGNRLEVERCCSRSF